jgi:hypothetical protein
VHWRPAKPAQCSTDAECISLRRSASCSSLQRNCVSRCLHHPDKAFLSSYQLVQWHGNAVWHNTFCILLTRTVKG